MHTLLRNTIVGGATMAVAAGAFVGFTQQKAEAAYSMADYGTYQGSTEGRSSDNGWGPKKYPDCPGESELGWATSANGVRVQVRKELVGLTQQLLDRTQQMGYTLRPDETGGFDCRGTRGPGTSGKASNHSRGRAIDLNVNSNPFSSGSLQTDIPPEVVKMWEAHGWYWGGRFLDAMHFDFNGTPADAQRFDAQLRGGAPASTPSNPAAPTNPPSSGSSSTSSSRPMLRQGSRGEDVRMLQQKLEAAGFSPKGADGAFGPNTEAAVRRFQAARGLQVDGIVGPATWAALG